MRDKQISILDIILWVLKPSSHYCYRHQDIVYCYSTQGSYPGSLSLFCYPCFPRRFFGGKLLIWPRILEYKILKVTHRVLFPLLCSQLFPPIPSCLQIPLHLSKTLTFGKNLPKKKPNSLAHGSCSSSVPIRISETTIAERLVQNLLEKKSWGKSGELIEENRKRLVPFWD